MNKFTAIDPNGVTHTRTSKTRTYTHTVVGRPSSVAATLRVTSKGVRALHRKNFAYHDAIAKGTSQWLERSRWETEEKYAQRRADDIAKSVNELNGCDTAQDYENMLVNAALEGIRHSTARGYYDKYHSLGWCGRADLAAKLKIKSENRRWVDVTILEAK